MAFSKQKLSDNPDYNKKKKIMNPTRLLHHREFSNLTYYFVDSVSKLV